MPLFVVIRVSQDDFDDSLPFKPQHALNGQPSSAHDETISYDYVSINESSRLNDSSLGVDEFSFDSSFPESSNFSSEYKSDEEEVGEEDLWSKRRRRRSIVIAGDEICKKLQRSLMNFKSFKEVDGPKIYVRLTNKNKEIVQNILSRCRFQLSEGTNLKEMQYYKLYSLLKSYNFGEFSKFHRAKRSTSQVEDNNLETQSVQQNQRNVFLEDELPGHSSLMCQVAAMLTNWLLATSSFTVTVIAIDR